MAWTIEFERDAIRQLNKLDRSIRAQIVAYVERVVVAVGHRKDVDR